MRNVIKAALIAVAVALAAPVAAQDFEAGLEAYKRGDYAAALRELRPLAEQGDAKAQTYLGYLYAYGQGVALDYAEAVKWYRIAAQSHAGAQYSLGVMYFRGLGVALDYAEAVRWYRIAAEQGYGDAQTSLGDMYAYGLGVQLDYVKAHMWLNLAANQGNVDAATKVHDIEALRMTPEQIAEAQKLAREWKPK